MSIYHSEFVPAPKTVGNMALLPLRTKFRGPAPNNPDLEKDVIDEALYLFKSLIFFRQYELKSEADRVLVYLILYILECLRKLQRVIMANKYEYIQRTGPEPDVQYPLVVKYCGECTMPLEYCEFSSHPDKCRAWLEKNLPDEFERLTAGGVEASQADVPAKGRQVRGGKGTTKKLVKQQIAFFKTSRGKKKYTTSITGLSTFGIDLKAAAKVFGRLYATGCSVTGNGDEIIIQGDFTEDLRSVLLDKFPELDGNSIEDLGEMKR